ncbi:MAG TPA: response regulator transcription factor [Kaistiaceae bacterium]|nr:response regulator transcription factor [Kaistiaceae bacterium]
MKVLVIEDDPGGRAVIAQGLEESGHEAVCAEDFKSGLRLAREGGYDALIVDRMLPDGDGVNIVKSLREARDTTPAVFLTALNDVDERIKGLRAGGDDYVAKPFSFLELLARLEAVTRRLEAAVPETVLKVGDLEVDVIERSVRRGGTEILLQPREFRLLEFLMRHAGRTVTRSMLLEGVWKYHFEPETKVIDVQMSRLRQKIDKDFDHPLIHTVRGSGYCIRAD